VAPGTFGSLVAMPLLPGLAVVRDRSPLAYVALLIALVLVAIWSAGLAEGVLGAHDHSRIVIDEVAGLALAGLSLPRTCVAAAPGFALSRASAVLKPFPAGLIDGRIEGGVGVVGDDLVAGIYAGLAGRLVLGLV